MNTCLSTIYLKLSKFDVRFIRLALLTLTAVLSVPIIEALPIHGDVGS